MPVLCPSCGTIGLDADRTCVECGTDLAGDPVALVAGEPASSAPRPTATPRPRRRRVALLVTGVAVAAIGAVVAGVVVTRGASGPKTAWTAIRLRLAPVPQPERVRVVGLGPNGRLRLADLATGRVRELRHGGTPVGATTALVRRNAIVFRAFDGRVEALVGLDRNAPRVASLGHADALVVSSVPDRVWLARGDRVEQVGTDGRVLTRATIPSGYRLSDGGLDDDALLLASTTSATSIVWNPRTHEIVAGTRATPAIAGASGTLVSTTCAPSTNTCRPLAIDLREGTTQPIDAPTWDGFEPPVVVGRVPPDGVPVAFGEAFPGHHDVRASITLVDPRSGRVMWSRELTQSTSEPTAWDDRGDLLFFTDGVRSFVHHVDGPSGNVVNLGPVRELDPVAVLPRPSPAPGPVARG